jgi:tetrahydromethanopterin S-methyltransferase subunit B
VSIEDRNVNSLIERLTGCFAIGRRDDIVLSTEPGTEQLDLSWIVVNDQYPRQPPTLDVVSIPVRRGVDECVEILAGGGQCVLDTAGRLLDTSL